MADSGGFLRLRQFVPEKIKILRERLVHLSDRLLHPSRRRRARQRLDDAAPAARAVLFVCHGNICRSPFAERAFASALPDPVRTQLRIGSTGFHPEVGRRCPPEARRTAREMGVDLSNHRSRSLLSTEDVRASEGETAAFVLEPDQSRRYRRMHSGAELRPFVLGDFDPEPISSRAIRDPFGAPRRVFEEVFERIRRCVNEVAAVWCAVGGESGV